MMDIAMASMQNSLRSVQQAISMSTLKKAMNQDAQSVTQLLSDMQQANANVAPAINGAGALLNVLA